MDTVYIILNKWGYGWNEHTLYRTHSKALFEFLKSYDSVDCPYYDSFSEELKADIQTAYDKQKSKYPEDTSEELDTEMSIEDAMEWLDSYGQDYHKFPVILGGTTGITSSWNW